MKDADAQGKLEQNAMFTAKQIVSYYDTSFALGMRIGYIGLIVGARYSNTISTLTAMKLSTILQGNN